MNEEDKFGRILRKSCMVIYPLAIYVIAVSFIEMFFRNLPSAAIISIAALVTLPVFLRMYQMQERAELLKGHKRVRISVKQEWYKFMVIIPISFCGCLGLNGFIDLIGITGKSVTWNETSQNLYSTTMLIMVLGVGICAPVVEELLFRGLIFGRMQDFLDKKISVLLTALLFGVYHMNIVQGIYAVLFGLIFAFLLERYGTILASILCHIMANLTSIYATEVMFDMEILTTKAGQGILTAIMLLGLGLSLLIMYKITEHSPVQKRLKVKRSKSNEKII